MAYIKNLEDELFVKNLLEAVKKRELSEEEVDRLEELFIDTYGYLPPNLCLHPQWLINKWQHKPEEQAEIERWYQNENIAFMESTPLELKDIDISFMCKEPNKCFSHQQYGFACRCVRQSFDTPTEFKLWAKNELTELKDELTDLLPEEK